MAALVTAPLIANPIPFPEYTLHAARTVRAIVEKEDGAVHTTLLIVSATGAMYEKGHRLKEAIYGEVCKGYVVEVLPNGAYRRNGVLVALKIIYRDRLDILRRENCLEDPMSEIRCLSYIRDTPTPSHPTPPNRYPNLCYFYEACHNESYIFSIMEFVEGSELYDYLDEHGAFLPGEAREAFGQIFRGWGILHSLGISHRDMSLENVMFSSLSGPRAVIIDFGMARLAQMSSHDGVRVHHLFPPLGRAGKDQYMAPEVFINAEPFRGSEVDVWAMGVMLFTLIAGHPPLTKATVLDDLFVRICRGQLPRLIAHWGHPFSPECVNLVNIMLQEHGCDRIAYTQLCSHPWWSVETP